MCLILLCQTSIWTPSGNSCLLVVFCLFSIYLLQIWADHLHPTEIIILQYTSMFCIIVPSINSDFLWYFLSFHCFHLVSIYLLQISTNHLHLISTIILQCTSAFILLYQVSIQTPSGSFCSSVAYVCFWFISSKSQPIVSILLW